MFDITETRTRPDAPQEVIEELTSIYKTKVRVPEKKPVHQFLLCPVGYIGVGKTTVVKPISEKLGLVRISTDEIRKLLKERGYNYNKVKEIGYSIIEYFLDLGFSITIDGNCGSKETRAGIKYATDKYKLDVVWLHIDPPDDFVIDKLKKITHTWLFKDSEEAVNAYHVYKKENEDYSKSDIPFFFTLDTSKPDILEQITEVEELLTKKFVI